MIILLPLRISLDLSKYFCSVFTADFSKYFDKFLDRLAIAYLQIKFVNSANYSENKRVLIVDLSMKPKSKAMWHVVSPAPLILHKYLILFYNKYN